VRSWMGHAAVRRHSIVTAGCHLPIIAGLAPRGNVCPSHCCLQGAAADASRVPAPVATKTLPWPFVSLAGSRRLSRHNCCSATTGCTRRTSRRRQVSRQTLSASGEDCTTTTARVWTSPTTSIPSATATCRSYRHVRSMLRRCRHMTWLSDFLSL
jgi:hypothetical protein